MLLYSSPFTNSTPNLDRYAVFFKGNEVSRVTFPSLGDLWQADVEGCPESDTRTVERDFIFAIANAREEAAPISPRIGAQAFVVPALPEVLRSMALQRMEDDDGFVADSCELLRHPHRYSPRFEIDGTGLTPELAVADACRKFILVLRTIVRHRKLNLIHAPSFDRAREFYEKHFTPFFTGNRSLHVIAKSASAPGTFCSEGLAAFAERVNAVAEYEVPDVGKLLDPQPYLNVRSPWRAPFCPHVKTGLWMNPVPWPVVWNADGLGILRSCLAPAVRLWAPAAIEALGFARPPNPELAPFYDALRHLGETAGHVDEWHTEARLPRTSSSIAREIDFEAALVDLKIRARRKRRSHGILYVLSACPLCEGGGGKAAVGSKGWLRCFRSSCEASDPGLPAGGKDGWIARAGLDPASYWVAADAQ